MKIAILTTDTSHHLYFVRQVLKFHKISAIVVERKCLTPSFETRHSFEADRDEYEASVLLENQRLKFVDFAETLEIDNVNDEAGYEFLSTLKPDVILSFGTELVRKPLISLCPAGFVNLHGGDPEYYRGLDTHLWAIYHRDFSQLVVTLHRLNLKLDDGEIVQQARIEIDSDTKIHQLRAMNTKLCIQLVVSAFSDFERFAHIISRPQRRIGRYYSFMPTELKGICCKNFVDYVKTL